jgi:type I restriction enzyme S subunit
MIMANNNENKILNVPNLRFPEFSGEWSSQPLTDFMNFKNGLNPDAKRFGRGTKFISVMDILNNQYICYDNIRASVELQDGDIETYGVDYGDILFQRSSETLEDVGRANVYLDSKPAIFGGFVIRGKSKGNYNPLFFRYLLASPTARKRIIVKGAGAQHFNIGQDGLSKVSLDIPRLSEQEKIGKLLQCVDARIATQNKIIEDLKKLKSAIIESHYNQTEKQTVFIADLGEPFNVGNLSKDDLSEAGNPCIIYGELFTTYGETISQIESHTNKKEGMTLSKKGDLLFPTSTTVDAISLIAPSVINVDGVILGGDMFGIHISTNFNAQYLSYYFNHIAKRQLAKFAKGSTIIHLHYTDIEKARLLLPSLEEQNKMANCLISLGEKIRVEKSYLQLLDKQKAYLLRQMFI